MHPTIQADMQQMEALLHTIAKQGLDFLQHIDERSTTAPALPPMTTELPQTGGGTLAALKAFNERFEPVLAATGGPRYWGFVTGGSTPASIAGDWFTTVYDPNPQGTTGQGDLSAVIELETIRLLLDLLKLPPHFVGGFVTGATMSNFTCLAAARQWLGKQAGQDIAKQGTGTLALPVLTATPHSSAIKSLAMLGMGSNNIILVNTLPGNREAIDVADLHTKAAALNGQPFILLSSGGTVNTVDFDDFNAIASMRSAYNFWWHIDAAFGGFAAGSSHYQYLTAGWEGADSITVDCHKWLNVPYDSAVFFVQEQHSSLQVETFQNSNAPYLGNPLENFSYLNFLPENSRRLRALPAWFSLMAYGKDGYRELIDDCIAAAQQLGHFVEVSNFFELLAPVRLNTVCFTLRGEDNPERITAFLQKLNATGKVFMTPTLYKGRRGIRAALVNWRTTAADVELVTALMTQTIHQLQ